MSDHKGGISESTIARMAGNIAPKAGVTRLTIEEVGIISQNAVRLARAIAAEVHRTAPVTPKEGS